MEIQTSENRIRDWHFLLFLFSGAFLFFSFLMWCAPYSSDDLEFAALNCSTLKEYAHFALYYGNGRFLGNLCAVLLSNFKLLCVLTKAFVLSSGIVLIPLALGLRDKCCFLLSFILVTAMEPNVFGEALTWTSGFSNYVWPIWISLVIFLLIQWYPTAKAPIKPFIFLAVPILGVASQLFIEHSSGVNGLLAFCFTVYYWKKGQRNKAVLSGIWLLATAVGLLLMLAIPRIFYRADNRVDNYRSMHLGSIFSLIRGCANNVIHLSNYYFGASEIPLCFGALVTIQQTKQHRSEKANHILFGLTGLSGVYLFLGMAMSVDVYIGKSAMIHHILAGASAFVPFIIWLIAAFKLDSQKRCRQLFLLGFALVSLLPLLIVSPTPPRVILQSYVFIILASLDAFAWSNFRVNKHTGKIMLIVCLCLVILLSSVFFSIHTMATARDAHIQREIAADAVQIEIFMLPYRYTTWDHLWSQGYIYENTDHIQFVPIDFYDWMQAYYH